MSTSLLSPNVIRRLQQQAAAHQLSPDDLLNHLLDWIAVPDSANGSAPVLPAAASLPETPGPTRIEILADPQHDYTYALRVLPDGQLETEWISGAFAAITGFTPEQSRERGGWSALMHPDDLPAAAETLGRLLAGPSDQTQVYRIITASGETRYLVSYLRSVWSAAEDRVTQIMGVARDITHQIEAETELHTRQRELNAIVDHALDGIITIDDDGTILSANPAMSDVLGAPTRQIIGTRVFDWVVRVDTLNTDDLAATWDQILTPQQSKGLVTIRRADNTRRIIEYRGRPRFMPGKHLAFLRDVTERERAIQQLERQMSLVRSINQVQTAFIDTADIATLAESLLDTLIDFTDSAMGFIGEVLTDPHGETYIKAWAMTDAAPHPTRPSRRSDVEFHRLDNLLGLVISSGEAVISNDVASDPRSGGAPLGQPAPVNFLGLPLKNGSRIVGMIGLANRADGYDLTLIDALRPLVNTCANLLEAHQTEQRRQQTEARLRASEEKFRKLVEAATEGVFLVDRAGYIRLMNARAEAIFGYSREELLGHSVDALVPAPLRAHHHQLHEHYFAIPTNRLMGYGRELTGVRRDGSEFPVEVSLNALEIGGEQMALCLFVDVTERKQIEQQRIETARQRIELDKERDLLDLKESFISLVSHEFRRPLTSIQFACDFVQRYRGKLSAEALADRITTIYEQAQLMNTLLNDILLISRSNANLLEFEPQPLDIVAFCETTIQRMREFDGGQHVIVIDTDTPAPFAVQADPRLLAHMFDNLISNALKYSPAGSTVTVTLRLGGGVIDWRVRDEGIGIPVDYLTDLYTPFKRAANVGSVDGTGLGLTVVQHCVRAHGGTVEFASVEGEGTTAIVCLPLDGQRLIGD